MSTLLPLAEQSAADAILADAFDVLDQALEELANASEVSDGANEVSADANAVLADVEDVQLAMIHDGNDESLAAVSACAVAASPCHVTESESDDHSSDLEFEGHPLEHYDIERIFEIQRRHMRTVVACSRAVAKKYKLAKNAEDARKAKARKSTAKYRLKKKEAEDADIEEIEEIEEIEDAAADPPAIHDTGPPESDHPAKDVNLFSDSD